MMFFTRSGFALFLHAVPIRGFGDRHWPEYSIDRRESKPSLEVALDAPPVAFPNLQAKIAVLESKHEENEAKAIRQLSAAGDVARKTAENCIQRSINQAVHGFAAKLTNEGTLFVQPSYDAVANVHVYMPEGYNGITDKDLNAQESKRDEKEKSMLSQACDVLNNSVVFVCNTLEAELRAALGPKSMRRKDGDGFLRGHYKSLPMSAAMSLAQTDGNVIRIVPPRVPYPTSMGFFKDMNARRNIAESLLVWRGLQIQVEVLSDMRKMINEKIAKAVATMLAMRS